MVLMALKRGTQLTRPSRIEGIQDMIRSSLEVLVHGEMAGRNQENVCDRLY
jgi:hypothetical protein